MKPRMQWTEGANPGLVRMGASPFVVHETQLLAVNEINPAPYNPRKISPRKFEALKEGILKNGFLIPLVIQKHSTLYGPMIIIGGHQRIKAVKEICIEKNVAIPKLPAVILDLDDRKAKMLNVALNNVEGEFDAKLLGEMLEEIHHEEVVVHEDIVMMGFEDDDMGKYLRLSDPPIIDITEPIEGTATLRLEFKDKKTRDAVKEKLEERAKVSKKSTGDVVFEMFGGKRKR